MGRGGVRAAVTRHIYSIACPACGETSWIDNGDTDDCSMADVGVIECPWCDHVFVVPGAEDYTDPETARRQRGSKSPDDLEAPR
jgi:hypothetical protein